MAQKGPAELDQTGFAGLVNPVAGVWGGTPQYHAPQARFFGNLMPVSRFYKGKSCFFERFECNKLPNKLCIYTKRRSEALPVAGLNVRLGRRQQIRDSRDFCSTTARLNVPRRTAFCVRTHHAHPYAPARVLGSHYLNARNPALF